MSNAAVSLLRSKQKDINLPCKSRITHKLNLFYLETNYLHHEAYKNNIFLPTYFGSRQPSSGRDIQNLYNLMFF
jgi:hypothetical protein